MLSNTRIVRIEWGDCDPAGIIFFPNYFRIFDHSTAMLFEAALGMTKFEMFKTLEFTGWPLVRTQAKFIKPTRFGDDVTVVSNDHLRPLQLRGRTQAQPATATLCAECSEKRVWTVRDADGRLKSHPVPDAVLEKFRLASA